MEAEAAARFLLPVEIPEGGHKKLIAFLQQVLRGLITKLVTTKMEALDIDDIDPDDIDKTYECFMDTLIPERVTFDTNRHTSSYSGFFNRVFELQDISWRNQLEHRSPPDQCKATLAEGMKDTCYLCARPIVSPPSGECEHLLPIIMALAHWNLYQGGPIGEQERDLLALEYAYAHLCCNRIKSNYDFIRYNSKKGEYEMNSKLIQKLLEIIFTPGNREGEKATKFVDDDCNKIVGEGGEKAGEKNIEKSINAAEKSINTAFAPLLVKINTNLQRYVTPDDRTSDRPPLVYELIMKIKILSAIKPDMFKIAIEKTKFKKDLDDLLKMRAARQQLLDQLTAIVGMNEIILKILSDHILVKSSITQTNTALTSILSSLPGEGRSEGGGGERVKNRLGRFANEGAARKRREEKSIQLRKEKRAEGMDKQRKAGKGVKGLISILQEKGMPLETAEKGVDKFILIQNEYYSTLIKFIDDYFGDFRIDSNIMKAALHITFNDTYYTDPKNMSILEIPKKYTDTASGVVYNLLNPNLDAPGTPMAPEEPYNDLGGGARKPSKKIHRRKGGKRVSASTRKRKSRAA